MQRPHLIQSLTVTVLVWIAAASSPAVDSRPASAFPGAQGFGAGTPGGRGGKILRVTNLKSKGPGSFVGALETKGPRIIVFEVGGIIDLEGKSVKILEPFVTIAGQTAPAPGITIIKGEFNLRTHDVIIQHIAVRPGEAGRAKKSGWEADGISTWGAFNIIVDHCSCTWATDENLSASGQRFEGETVEDWRQHTSHHVTFSNCIIAEGLSQSTHKKGEHSKGSLIHDNASCIAIIGNLYASNVERNPLAKGGVQMAVINNWIANPGRKAMHHHLVPSEWGRHPPVASRLAVAGNVMELGPDSRPDISLLNNSSGPLELYLKDNLAVSRDHQPAPMTAGTFTRLDQPPLWPEGLTPLPAEKVRDYVAKNAGARPWDRDPIDQRIVRAALDGSGKIINSEKEAGGYPVRPSTSAPFKPLEWNLETLTPLRPPGQKAGL